MNTRHPYRLVLALAFAQGLVASLPAQSAPAAATTDNADDQPVVLETFTINTDRDRGYIAVDALAGGRTNTPIKLTPAAMSSLTRTFIDDLRLQSVRDALRWAPNVVATDPLAGRGFGGQAFHPWSFNFRGAGAGQQGGPGPTRNYFTFFEDADTYNVERVEFTRGPNGILFGLGTVGGTLSTYTKVPRLDKTFFSPTVSVDSNEGFRVEADYNIAASDRLALRLNLVYDEARGWRNNDEGEKRGVDLAFLYKLTDRTQLRLELEGFEVEQNLVSSNIGDKASGWDGVTASQTWAAEPTGGATRTVRISGAGGWGDWLNAYPVFIPTLGSKALMLWAPWNADRSAYLGGFASTGSLLDVGAAPNWAPYAGWYPAQIKLPWETTYSSTARIPVRPSREWTYGSGLATNDYENLTLWLDHRFTDNVDLQLSYFTYDTETVARNYEGTGGAAVDLNQQLPDGTPNPNFGKTFADFFLSKQSQERAVDEVRGQLNYQLSGELFGAGFHQTFAASASQRTTKISARQYLAQIGNSSWVNNPVGDWVHNMVWGRLYLDRPNAFTDIPESIGGYNIAYMPKADGYWFDFDDKFELTSYAFFSNTRLFDDRLSIALGARRDSYDEHLVSLRRGPNLTDDIDDESDSGTTFTAGAIYYFGWLGVFANYSESLLPPNAGSQPYINGARPGPEENEGYDYGLRVSTGDGKYYATVSRYDSTSNNRNVENPVNIRGIWQAYNVARGVNQDSGFGGIAYSDTQALDASGYEFEVTANPTQNLRIQASYSRPDTEITDFYPMVRAHVAENLAAWNTQLNATTNTTHAANLRNSIASVQDVLAQSRGGNPQQGTVDYTASLFAHYTFTGDLLPGFSVGAGTTFTGQSYQLTANNIPHYGDSYRSVDLLFAYETKIGRTRVRFALNVENLLDYDDPIVTGYHWGYEDQSGHRIRDAYYFQTPRTFRLSARFTF